jgi:tellurite resistance protein
MPQPSTNRAPAPSPLCFLSPAIFTIPMSFAGLALTAQRVEELSGWRPMLSTSLLALAIAALALVTFVYGLKAVRHPDCVKGDWRHPVQVSFFAPYGMTLVLIAAALLHLQAPVAAAVWISGAALLLITAFATLATWITRDGVQPAHLLPVWFLPLVGPTLIAQAGVRLGFPEISNLALSFATLGWLFFMPLVLQRLVFGPPVPPPLLPSLAILVAPEALIFISAVEVAGGLTEWTRLLFGATTVMGLLVLILAPRMLRAPFSLGWWAFSFPIAAWASATLRYGTLTGSTFYLQAGRVLFAAVTLMTALLIVRTIQSALRGDLTRPPPV